MDEIDNLRERLVLQEIDMEEKDKCLTRTRRMIEQMPVHIDLAKEEEEEEEMWIDFSSNKKRRTQQEMLQEQQKRFQWYE